MFARPLIGVALALTVGILPILPPEHVHEVEEHGQQHGLLHRHLDDNDNPHHSTASHHSVSLEPTFDDDDAPIATFEATYTVPSVTRVETGLTISVPVILDAPGKVAILGAPEYFERLIHGPPRAPAGLRAPPPVSLL